MRTLIFATALAVLAGAPALAKLPQSAPTPEAQAKAAEAAARTAWNGKVEAYKLCRVQDHVVAHYRSGAAAGGKPVPEAMASPPCADPGPFVFAPAEASRPVAASGAPASAPPAAPAPKAQ